MPFKRLTFAGVLLYAGWAYIFILCAREIDKGLLNVVALVAVLGTAWLFFCAGVGWFIKRFRHQPNN